jgi:hypothetical protein
MPPLSPRSAPRRCGCATIRVCRVQSHADLTVQAVPGSERVVPCPLCPGPESRGSAPPGQRPTAPSGGRSCNDSNPLHRQRIWHHKPRCSTRAAPTWTGRALARRVTRRADWRRLPATCSRLGPDSQRAAQRRGPCNPAPVPDQESSFGACCAAIRRARSWRYSARKSIISRFRGGKPPSRVTSLTMRRRNGKVTRGHSIIR